MPLAQAIGGLRGFPLRDHWFLSSFLHDAGHRAGWLLLLAICLGLWWPTRPLHLLPFPSRLQLAAGILLSLLLIAILKTSSSTSCPWDLAEFGQLARYTSHWSRLADGGPGRCFPAGHAATGFAFIGGFFVFRKHHPSIARRWLWISVLAGFVFGIAQQLRVAHFMSHTLWTGFLCLGASALLDRLWPRLTRRFAAPPLTAKG